ncbi:MAG: ATP-binding protein [bacterium]
MNKMQGADLPWLIKTYFSDPSKRIQLKKGEILMEEGGYNDKLYLVLRGYLKGYVETPDKSNFELFQAPRHKFVGVYSFFSKTFSSSARVVAEEDSEVAYIDPNIKIVPSDKGNSLFEQFMPVVVSDLAQRQQEEQKIGFEKERALKKLIQSERLASLGQMATGIAHELNNAIVVLERNTHWLCDKFAHMLEKNYSEGYKYFKNGLNKGRELSTREIRRQKKNIKKKFSVNEEDADKLAALGLDVDSIADILSNKQISIDTIYHYWQLGVSFNDMKIAARLGTNVVTSVKALGGQKSIQKEKCDLNETVKKALTLLSSPLRGFQLSLSLSDLPFVIINKSDWVQVWTNLVKNSIESLNNSDVDNKLIEISSYLKNKNIFVTVRDNGPGIPEEIQQEVFKPNFTTKERGLEFGLGLGLVISERIIRSYKGDIFLSSQPGKTIFTIKIPV